MREIKFRAWLPKQKMFFYWGFNLRNDGAFFDSPPSVRDSIQMQYTGIKDKTDKEIYEGDIIKIVKSYDYATKDKPETVTFYIEDDGGCSYSMIGIKPEGNNGSDFALHELSEDCKVIGNIYENPELLEDK